MADYRSLKKPKRVRYHFSIVFFAAVFIFGFMFWKYMKTTTLEDVLSQDRDIFVPALSFGTEDDIETDDASIIKDMDHDNTEGTDTSNPVPKSEKKSSEYFDDCVFIGDFMAYGLSSYGLVPASSVYASMSMNVSKADTELLDTQYGRVTAIDALKQKNPKNIYIMLGSNGVAWMTISDMYTEYTSFVTAVRQACPDSKIYLISVPPVTAAKEISKESPIKNTDINEFNLKLLDYANDKKLSYLDINGELKDENGCLPSDCAENDGIHFKHSTYETLVDYVLTHVS